MIPHWLHKDCNRNKFGFLDPLQPYPSSRKRKASQLVSPLSKRIWTNFDLNDARSQELSAGWLGSLGTDTLYNILIRLDVHALFSCLQVNKALLNIIASPTFRRSWRGQMGVLAGSRTGPWRLRSDGDVQLFQPLNIPSCPGQVVASAGGLLCINMHPTNRKLELVVGNPLTREWVLLPVPEGEFDALIMFCSSDTMLVPSRLSFAMEVFPGGHFKVAVYEKVQYLHRLYFYHSASNSDGWRMGEKHYMHNTPTQWSDLDLRRPYTNWRLSFIANIGCDKIEIGLESPLDDCYLSHPFDHGFCVWEYGSAQHFAAAWVSYSTTTATATATATSTATASVSGYGVWKIVRDVVSWKQEAVLVSARKLEQLVPHFQPRTLHVSCNARDNLVCFIGETHSHQQMPAVVYDIHCDSWVTVEPDTISAPPPITSNSVEEAERPFVAVVYSPSLISPAAVSVDEESAAAAAAAAAAKSMQLKGIECSNIRRFRRHGRRIFQKENPFEIGSSSVLFQIKFSRKDDHSSKEINHSHTHSQDDHPHRERKHSHTVHSHSSDRESRHRKKKEHNSYSSYARHRHDHDHEKEEQRSGRHRDRDRDRDRRRREDRHHNDPQEEENRRHHRSHRHHHHRSHG